MKQHSACPEQNKTMKGPSPNFQGCPPKNGNPEPSSAARRKTAICCSMSSPPQKVTLESENHIIEKNIGNKSLQHHPFGSNMWNSQECIPHWGEANTPPGPRGPTALNKVWPSYPEDYPRTEVSVVKLARGDRKSPFRIGKRGTPSEWPCMAYNIWGWS